MRPSSRCLVAAAVAAASLVVGLGAAASSVPTLPTGVGCESHGQVRPSQIILSCADYNSYFGSIHWASWGATSATGTGQFMFNACSPNCATSKVADRGAVRLVASSASSEGPERYFRQLKVTRISTHRSVTLTWDFVSSLTQIGSWHGSTAPLIAAG